MVASRSVAITYVPADCGSIIPGKSKAPQAFRDVGIVEQLKAAGVPSVTERQALDAPAHFSVRNFVPGGVRNEGLNLSVCEDVYATLVDNLDPARGDIPFQLILGGECCMAPAIMSAVWNYAEARTYDGSPPKRVGLLYIDADTDLNSPADPTSTGYFAGMNMTHLLRTPGALPGMEKFTQRGGEPVCDPSNIVFFGVNMESPSNKPEHLKYLSDNGYKVVSSASVARNPGHEATQAMKYLEDNVDMIMVHLDVDSIDPQMFPLANVPNFTGVTFQRMMRALSSILSSRKVIGLTIAEVNPDHDPGLKMTWNLTDSIAGYLAMRK